MTAPEPIECPLKSGLLCLCTEQIKSESRCGFCDVRSSIGSSVSELAAKTRPNSQSGIPSFPLECSVATELSPNLAVGVM